LATRQGLVVLLTVWAAISRPSMASLFGTPSSTAWWESPAFAQIRREAAAFKAKGNWAGWESAYERGYAEAVRQGILSARISYLSALGSVRMLRFRYPEALEAYLAARQLAESAGDWLDAGGIAINLTSLYAQVWDLPSALAAIEGGRAALRHVPSAYYRTELLLQLAHLHALQDNPDAEQLFEEGIEAARQHPAITLAGEDQNAALEAQGWDSLGAFRLKQNRFAAAERAILEAYRLRVLHSRGEVPDSWASLGALALAQGDRNTAERFTRRAIEAVQRRRASVPLHPLFLQLGRIYRAEGRTREALKVLGDAVDSALKWRSGVLPATSTLIGSNSELDRDVFDSFVEAAAEAAAASGDRRLAAESFLASESSRASSLRETQALAPLWRAKLPPEYWETLSKLRAEQGRALREGGSDRHFESRLQLKLTEMEALAGLGFFSNIPENFRDQNSLIHFQRRLKSGELFLSFHLGSRKSYLWAASRGGLRLYALAPEQEIRRQAEDFRAAVAQNRSDAEEQGSRFYKTLFGQLRPEEAGKPEWLLSLEGPLFDTPFAALVAERIGGKVHYLVEKHSVQVVPGAFSLGVAGPARADGRMLAVGDPVYNLADPRWTGSILRGWITHAAADFELNRLPGSGTEARSSAAVWGLATVLEGSTATRSRFLDSLTESPAVIHLATHVVSDPLRPDQAFIAFGIGAERRPEPMPASEIASLRVPGALVVMTGCSSGTGAPVAGAGLLGLTRAWMVAGARAVVATKWPVNDGSGGLLGRFYGELKSSTPAEALRRAQVQAIHSGTGEARPQHWAAYEVSGGAR
jgi:CHAT domain-containing protein